MVKLIDVAQAAGVSVTTASMVLNPGKQVCRVRPECADRIRLAAKKLGYVGNYHARAMQLGRAETIGMAIDVGRAGHAEPWIAAMGGPYFSTLAGGVETHTHFKGYNLALIGPGINENAADRGLKQIQQRRLDALVVAAVLPSVAGSRLITEQPKAPVVLMEYEGTTQLPNVTYGEAEGVQKAVKYLAEFGHKEIVWLGPDTRLGNQREQMFIRAAWDCGLRGASCRFEQTRHTVRAEDPVADASEAALARYLTQKPAFTAVLGYNDSCAIGAYGALMRAGLRIPQDVSVIGFDDVFASHVFPRLTTISHMLHEMGLRAAELATEISASAEAIEQRRGYRDVIIPDLIIRDSAGPARS
ncbi:MAG TPA: LacI family DNA-binding transcriptional regulator [Planctomycetota bacterium]|nr:LacI family DNA-binding transcriptional regulator [Planctomycetota bacterium]